MSHSWHCPLSVSYGGRTNGRDRTEEGHGSLVMGKELCGGNGIMYHFSLECEMKLLLAGNDRRENEGSAVMKFFHAKFSKT
jgi:hypothetical protein